MTDGYDNELLRCPCCFEPTLHQQRVRVFPVTPAGIPSGCAIMEQGSGSVLILREDDLIHARPVKDTPVVTIVFTCDNCPDELIQLHILTDQHTSHMVWDTVGEDRHE